MIKIEKITPLGSRAPQSIDSLRVEFIELIFKLNHIPKLLTAIDLKKLADVNLTERHVKCLKYICENYERIIIGRPLELESIVTTFDRKGWNNEINNGGTRTQFGIALTNLFGYTGQFRSEQRRGVWFALQMNIKVCPYCNSQYTLVVDRKNKGALAKFQFDHFFPLEKFPYLSVSLYNIIPSCAACNHRKANARLQIKKSYHPYYNSISEFAKFQVQFPDNFKKLLFPQLLSMDVEKIAIKFISKYDRTRSIIQQYDAMFDISAMYTRHKDVAHTIMIQSTLYNRYYQKSVMNIKNLFPDEATMLKYILGSSLDGTDTLNKPLSKFTQDIARTLKLIK